MPKDRIGFVIPNDADYMTDRGFAKLVNCSEEARRRGLSFFFNHVAVWHARGQGRSACGMRHIMHRRNIHGGRGLHDTWSKMDGHNHRQFTAKKVRGPVRNNGGMAIGANYAVLHNPTAVRVPAEPQLPEPQIPFPWVTGRSGARAIAVGQTWETPQATERGDHRRATGMFNRWKSVKASPGGRAPEPNNITHSCETGEPRRQSLGAEQPRTQLRERRLPKAEPQSRTPSHTAARQGCTID